MSAHKVRVQVSLYHVLYLQAFACGLHDVTVNVALRVNDSRFAFRTYEIRSMCEASEVELFKVHGRPPLNAKLMIRNSQLAFHFAFLILHSLAYYFRSTKFKLFEERGGGMSFLFPCSTDLAEHPALAALMMLHPSGCLRNQPIEDRIRILSEKRFEHELALRPSQSKIEFACCSGQIRSRDNHA